MTINKDDAVSDKLLMTLLRLILILLYDTEVTDNL